MCKSFTQRLCSIFNYDKKFRLLSLWQGKKGLHKQLSFRSYQCSKYFHFFYCWKRQMVLRRTTPCLLSTASAGQKAVKKLQALIFFLEFLGWCRSFKLKLLTEGFYCRFFEFDKFLPLNIDVFWPWVLVFWKSLLNNKACLIDKHRGKNMPERAAFYHKLQIFNCL